GPANGGASAGMDDLLRAEPGGSSQSKKKKGKKERPPARAGCARSGGAPIPGDGPRRDITWQEFGELCKQLAVAVYNRGPIDAVVGIARGGSIVGTTLSFMLNKEYFPIRLAKRGGVTRVIVPPTRDLADRSVC